MVGSPILLRTEASIDEDGMLVFAEGERLMAVLTRLSNEHPTSSGRWFLEAGFGRLQGPGHPTSADLEEAQEWLSKHVSSTSFAAWSF